MRKTDAPSIAESFDYQAGKRSTLDGIAQAALDGDHACLVRIADWAANVFHRMWLADQESQEGRAALHLMTAMDEIRQGKSPNEAFGVERPGKKGRPKSFEALRKAWLVGHDMQGIVQNIAGKTPDAAAEHLSEAFRWPHNRAADAVRCGIEAAKGRAVSRARLSKAAAREVAANVVSQHRRVSRDSALDALRNLGGK